jgi:lysine/arginine/ornithine transport system substrate-binding protein/histidine transport system substrate-binding protein
VNVVPYPNQDVLYQDMVSGRLDATLQDAIMVDAGFLKSAKGKGFAFAGNNVVDAKTLGVGAAIGLRKEDADLKKNIDKALAEIIADGTYKKLEKKYFSFSIY